MTLRLQMRTHLHNRHAQALRMRSYTHIHPHIHTHEHTYAHTYARIHTHAHTRTCTNTQGGFTVPTRGSQLPSYTSTPTRTRAPVGDVASFGPLSSSEDDEAEDCADVVAAYEGR